MVSLRQVVEDPGLGAWVVTAGPLPDVELTGAHASEQIDPTPWLRGGELLMSDGLNLGRRPSSQQAYVARLAQRRVGALAIGVGGNLPFAAVPPALIKAAEAAGIPVLAVPVTTPFIAITQTVYSHMAEERFATTQRSLEGQRSITAGAASADALTGILNAFAREATAWAVTFDARATVVASAGDNHGEATRAIDTHAADLRKVGLRGSASATTPRGAYAVQPLGTSSLQGFLVYGRDRALAGDPVLANLAAFAVSLLSIELQRRHVVRVLERRPGSDAIPRLLGGLPPARAAQLLRFLRVGTDRVQVLIVTGSLRADELMDDVSAAIPGILVRQDGPDITAIVPDDAEAVSRLGGILATEVAGIGGAVEPHNCPASLRQARHAAKVSANQKGGLVRALDLGTVQVLLQLASADALRAFADSVLGPLETTHGRSNRLIGSLRAYLEFNGSHEAAAVAVGVHRHTMRHHIHRIEELTGRQLESPRDRTELWLAFEARDLIATLEPPTGL